METHIWIGGLYIEMDSDQWIHTKIILAVFYSGVLYLDH